MIVQSLQNRGGRFDRNGIAAVELAFLLPLLIFMCMATVDFARVSYVQVTLQNCARNGALYEFYKAAGYTMPSGWTSLLTAVQADAGNLTVTVPTTHGLYANPYTPGSISNNTITVAVQCSFTLISYPSFSNLPSVPGSLTLVQTATMPYPNSMTVVQQ
jgi:Flp pilus assembly protein TadG